VQGLSNAIFSAK